MPLNWVFQTITPCDLALVFPSWSCGNDTKPALVPYSTLSAVAQSRSLLAVDWGQAIALDG
jgi:hypothetical protein